MTASLQKFIESLDPSTLPRILQIQSGFYYGGSFYEEGGNELSLSTGDVIKVTHFKVRKVLAHLHTSNEYSMLPTMELPPDFPGLFKVVAKKEPYHSIEEIVQSVHNGSMLYNHPCFFSNLDLHVGDIFIAKGTNIMFHSLKETNGAMTAMCAVIMDGRARSFYLPLSYTGKFFECQDERTHTLDEIVSWKITEDRSRTVILAHIKDVYDYRRKYSRFINEKLTLSPIYEIQVQMQYGGIVNVLSDLDVEVLDVTEDFNMKGFAEILTTQDIFEKNTNEFPFIAEIVSCAINQSKLFNFLKPGKKIIVHRKYQADRMIASEIRSNTSTRHFLIPSNYKGKFKRRPRFFPTVYDLNIASKEMNDLHVVATKAFASPHPEFSSICMGDKFIVKQSQSFEFIHKGKMTVVDGLECTRTTGLAKEITRFPLYVEGGFLELVNDSKQYTLSELCKDFVLPLIVKVSVRDLFTVGEDILSSTSVLKLEEKITDSYLLVSLYDIPEEVWELPVYRSDLSFIVHGCFTGEVFINPTRTNTEEINEEEYYMARRYENSFQTPPPRPPKTPSYSMETKVSSMNEILSTSEMSEETSPSENQSCSDHVKRCIQEDAKRTAKEKGEVKEQQ